MVTLSQAFLKTPNDLDRQLLIPKLDNMAKTFETPMLGPAQQSLVDVKRPYYFPCGGDWRSCGLIRVPTPKECAAVCLPIKIYPKDHDYVLAKNTVGLKWLVMPQEVAPWTGYYATFEGAKIAISSMFGVWFEIRCREQSWEAFQVSRVELNLQYDPLPGINAPELIKSGEPMAAAIGEQMRVSRAASRASHRDEEHDEPPYRNSTGDPGRYLPGGLGNTRPRYKDNDDDPFSSNIAR